MPDISFDAGRMLPPPLVTLLVYARLHALLRVYIIMLITPRVIVFRALMPFYAALRFQPPRLRQRYCHYYTVAVCCLFATSSASYYAENIIKTLNEC